jgi:hypothetical protein
MPRDCNSGAAGYMARRSEDKCREKIQGTEETEMRRIVLALCQIVDLIAVSGVYITFAMLSNTAGDATPGGKTPPLQPLPAR